MNMKDIIDSVPSATASEGDFVEEGILHCGRCRSPKESKISFPWGEQVVRTMCKCEQEEFRKRTEEEKNRRRMEYVESIRDTLIPRGLRGATFANDNGSNPELPSGRNATPTSGTKLGRKTSACFSGEAQATARLTRRHAWQTL